jgi:ABC-2 type transport system ATP-binding protein
MTVLMTTHYMDEADANCDRVALMHAGRIRASGRPGELRAPLGDGATLDDVFCHYAGGTLDDNPEKGGSVSSVAPGAPPAVSADPRPVPQPVPRPGSPA